MFTPETIAMMQAAKEGLVDLQKSTFNQPSGTATQGWQAYNLEPPKELIPTTTPLLSEIPRTGGGFANQANWKVASGLNSINLTSGVPQASRNAQIDYTLYEYSAVFKTLYMEAGATLQARLAGQGFDDPDARATRGALTSHMIENEWIILGGNTTNTGLALGQVTGVAGAVNAAGGAISTATLFFQVVPLTLDGWRQATSFGIGQNNASDNGAVRTVTPVYGSAFGVNLGAGQPSVEASVTGMAGGTNKVTITWNAKPGAVAYAVYVGATTGSEKFAGLAYSCSFVQSANAPTTTQAASAITGDRSQNQYVYDGIITQIVRNDPNTGTNAGYYKSINGTLTATGKGGINEFDAFLIDRMDKFKVSLFDIWVGTQQTPNITAKVTQGSAATPYMVSIASGEVNLTGGQRVTAYSHPITGEKLAVRYHPSLPPGLVLFKIKALPAEYYRNDNIPNPWQVKEWLSYTSIHWPENTFQRDVGVVTAEVLQGYVPFGNGLLSEIVIG
jgi:hypothetical protein